MKTLLKKPILALLMFLVIQAVISFVVLIPMMALSKLFAGDSAVYSSYLVPFALILSSLVSILFMRKPLHMIELRPSFRRPNLSLAWGFGLVVASFVGIFATNIFSEMMELPDLMADTMADMCGNWLGILAIGIVGPIAEEVTFRGAIQGWFQRHGLTPAKSILWASVFFGLMHLNPAQIPFAMLVGCILGFLYWRTDSLVLPCIVHILNNTLACILANLLPADFSMVEALGGTLNAVLVAVLCLIVCYMALARFAKATR